MCTDNVLQRAILLLTWVLFHLLSEIKLYGSRLEFTFHRYHKIFGEIWNLIISEITFIYWIYGFPVNRSDDRALLEDERE